MENHIEYFSLNGEDFLLWELIGGGGPSFYVDINVQDGLTPSNSLLFEKAGWQGLCIEPVPDLFIKCSENRPGALCLNRVCVGEGNRTEVRASRDGTSSRDEGRGGVQTITLNEICQQCADHGDTPGFVSIKMDHGGPDILAGFEAARWRVRILLLTANTEIQARLAHSLIIKQGYILSRVFGLTGIYANSAHDANFLQYKRVVCDVPVIGNCGSLVGKGETAPKRRIEELTSWIVPNVLCQQKSQPLWSLLDYFPEHVSKSRERSRIVHVINPYSAGEYPASGRCQALVYDSMRQARDDDSGVVTLVSIQHADEEDLTPDGFIRGGDLTRDVTEFGHFRKPQRLPLLFDILENGAAQAQADDVLIYTNSDIVLMPYFYLAVRDCLKFGFDALNICRRTIGEHRLYTSHRNLARSEVGYPHPGSDCFVFTKEVYSRFVRNNACIGRKGIAKSLLLNMVAASTQMLVLKNVKLTYHLGDDRSWAAEEVQDYTQFNMKELGRVYRELCNDVEKRKLLDEFAKKYWMEDIFVNIS